MIQRAHNMGLKMNIMKGVEGASNDKSESLAGNNYAFSSPKQLILKLLKGKDVLREGITPEKIDEMIKESFTQITGKKIDSNLQSEQGEPGK